MISWKSYAVNLTLLATNLWSPCLHWPGSSTWKIGVTTRRPLKFTSSTIRFSNFNAMFCENHTTQIHQFGLRRVTAKVFLALADCRLPLPFEHLFLLLFFLWDKSGRNSYPTPRWELLGRWSRWSLIFFKHQRERTAPVWPASRSWLEKAWNNTFQLNWAKQKMEQTI